MQVVVSMQDVDAFGLIPGKALCRYETLGSHVVVRECNDAVIDVDIVPQARC